MEQRCCKTCRFDKKGWCRNLRKDVKDNDLCKWHEFDKNVLKERKENNNE